MPQLHYQLLDKNRQTVFKKLQPFKKEVVLAGGTALLLQIGHRASLDFDLFLKRELKRNDLVKLRKIFKIKELRLNTSEQLNVITKDDILITLVYYPYKPLFKVVPTTSVPLFSVKDIALDKAHTIGRRAAWRDYVDLFFILKNNYIDIAKIIKLSPKKFGVEFNARLFLEQLIYFNDLERAPISFIKQRCNTKEIKEYLTKQVKKYKNSQL